MKLKNKNFKLVKKEKLKDIQSEYLEFEYLPLGTKFVWIKNKDQDRAFTVAFRTPPTNDKGINHILEHSVFRGSRKYPFEKADLLTELVQKTINTYINAATYPDRTIYPFSSNNEKDFLKILDSYVDMVLFPKILEKKEIFQQEGWRYDIDENGKIFFNGVVFNEMKGRNSSIENILWNKVTKNLFTDTVYSYESGGDPKEIIKLEHQELIDYHKKFYHPSNSIFYFYGDLKIEKIFDYLEKEFLTHFKKKKINSKIKPQKKFKTAKVSKEKYFSENKDENVLSFNFIVGDVWDLKNNFLMIILHNILLNGDVAKLKEKLLKTGLFSSVESYIENELNKSFLQINLKGLAKKNLKKGEKVFWDSLNEILAEGLKKEEIEVEFSALETALKMQNLKTKRGLTYMEQVMTAWTYDVPIENVFKISEFLNELKKEIFEPKYLENIIKEKIVKNNFALHLTLLADSKLDNEKDLKKEIQKINKISEKKKATILKEISEFKKWKEKKEPEENLNLIKSLKPKDLKGQVEKFKFETEKKKYIFQKSTSGINSFALAFDLKHLKPKEFQYLNLYFQLLNKNLFFSEKKKAVDFLMERKKFFGSLKFNLNFFYDKKGKLNKVGIVEFAILSKNRKKAFGFLNEIFNEIKIKKDDLEILIKNEILNFKNSLAYHGNSFATVQNLSGIDKKFKFINECSGLDYLNFLENIEVKDVFEEIEKIKEKIWNKNYLFVSETGKKKDATVFDLLKLKSKKYEEYKIKFKKEKQNKAFVFNDLMNNFNSMIFDLDGQKFKTENFKILEPLFTYDYLWKKIREEGGAYGTGAGISDENDEKFFELWSYMDSRVDETFEDFEKIVEFLENYNFTAEKIDDLIVKRASKFWLPSSELSWAYRNLVVYLSQSNNRDKKYQEVLNFKKSNIKKLVSVLKEGRKKKSLVSLGNENNLKKAKKVKI